jgi:UDP-glucose 4-epimerase
VTGLDWKEPRRPVEGWRDVRVDIRDDAAVQRAVAEARPELVWHLAAQASVSISMREPRLDIETNCIATVTLAQAAAAAGTRRFVFTGSGGAMFGPPPELPARDETPVAPRSIYGASKVAAERYLEIVGLETGMEVAGLRPGNIYGPYQDPHGEAGVVAIFTQRMLRGEPCTIFGTGEDTRDYVYVDDVVEAFVRAAEAPMPAFCLVGTGRETSTREIFDLLARETGYERSPVAAPPRPGDIPRICLDTSRAQDLWGWQPAVEIADGMARTVAAFREELGMTR